MNDKPINEIESIARLAHEMNRRWCELFGDTSQPAWEDAPDWQRKSTISGVEFHRDNPDAAPSHIHENWLKEKLEDGWGYGEVKDPDKKTHPCCVPYEQLPSEQRAKDAIFIAVVRSMLE